LAGRNIAVASSFVHARGCESANAKALKILFRQREVLFKSHQGFAQVLNPLSPVESMELLLDKLGRTRSNGEFLAAMSG
jgi:transcription termination factor Rho